ncbi:MAG TPA: hypothetical protein VMV95_02260 [Bacillota bacterium]|nr:hypothetical protein [Bacillota bacterium]
MYSIKKFLEYLNFESKSSLREKLKNEISSRENFQAQVIKINNELKSEIFLRENSQSQLIKINDKLEKVSMEKEEFEELSEICLKERDELKEEYENLKLFLTQKSYKKIMENFFSLSKLEASLLLEAIPKKTSEKNFKDKIKYQKTHSDPRRFDEFLIKLSKVNYVDEIRGGQQTHRNVKRTFFDRIDRKNDIFILEGLYAENGFGKYIFVSTTARNEREANYIKDFLNSFLSNFR